MAFTLCWRAGRLENASQHVTNIYRLKYKSEDGMTIEYRIRSVYGEDRMYLVDPDMARAVERLTGCKTVTLGHTKALESMGFELIQVI